MDEKMIEHIKSTTDLCDTNCCYEDCEKCIGEYIKSEDYLGGRNSE